MAIFPYSSSTSSISEMVNFIFKTSSQELWDICPENRRRKGSKKQSKAVYDTLIRDGVSHSVIMKGTEAYAAYVTATGEKNLDYERFLKRKLFTETWTIPPNNGGGGGGLDDMEKELRERNGE